MRRSPLYEVVGQLGMWGMIINAIQAAGLEHKAIREATWSGMNSKPISTIPHSALTVCSVGILVAYTASMFILYTVAPLLYRMASSAYYNLSILSSDFYGLLFGLFLFVRYIPSQLAWLWLIDCFSITGRSGCTSPPSR